MTERPIDERALVELMAGASPQAPVGETWIGDDAAVVSLSGTKVLFATDSVVAGVHFFAGDEHLADAGWKSLVRNLSDVAAMGGIARYAVAAVAGASSAQILAIHGGLSEAAQAFGCPVVGGDMSSGESLVMTVTVLGEPGPYGPVLRSGARPGDGIFCTGALGRSAAGLRELRGDMAASGPNVEAYRRPMPRLAEGHVIGSIRATAMLDISDGLGIDLHRLADASSVGFVLDTVPVAEGATEAEAVAGGEDYELLFTSPATSDVVDRFLAAGLTAPMRIGTVAEDPSVRTLAGNDLGAEGWGHNLG